MDAWVEGCEVRPETMRRESRDGEAAEAKMVRADPSFPGLGFHIHGGWPGGSRIRLLNLFAFTAPGTVL